MASLYNMLSGVTVRLAPTATSDRRLQARRRYRAGATPARWATAALLACSAGQALAGPGNDYCITHTFNITTPGNQPPLVAFGYRARAYARTNTCIATAPGPAGTVAIGVGLTTFTTGVITAPDSTADATAEANITTLVAGNVAGTIEASGNATALITGCPPPALPRGRGWARASSAAQVAVRGQTADRTGNIRFSGGWRNSPPVAGGTERGLIRDPIRARLTDNTTGEVQEWTLMSVHASNSDGELAWDGGMLSNTSLYAEFHLLIDSPVTVQQGELRIRVSNGVVIESVASGMFASTPIPDPGEGGFFDVPLGEISMDFDMGGNPDHDLVPELEFDNGGEVEKHAAGMEPSLGTLMTDIGTGSDGSNVSELPRGDGTLGFIAQAGMFHIADDFMVTDEPWTPDSLRVAVFQTDAPHDEQLQAAFVRIWRGPPFAGGAPVGGDMTTNRLMDTEFSDMYRVQEGNPSDPANAIRYAVIDLGGMPELVPGQYWAEVAFIGSPGHGPVVVPPVVWTDPNGNHDNAAGYDERMRQWRPLTDSASGRMVSLPMNLYGSRPARCPADFDGDGFVTGLDFDAFIAAFEAGDLSADFDADGFITGLDFDAYVGAFEAGC